MLLQTTNKNGTQNIKKKMSYYVVTIVRKGQNMLITSITSFSHLVNRKLYLEQVFNVFKMNLAILEGLHSEAAYYDRTRRNQISIMCIDVCGLISSE